MTNYEITGWDLATCALGTARLWELLNLLSENPDRLCLEAHFEDYESMALMAHKIPSSRFALYGWGEIGDATFFKRPECPAIQSARIVYERRSLTLAPDEEMPAYDWHGNPSGTSGVVLAERHQEPVDKENRDPSATTLALVSELATNVAGATAKIKTSSAMTGDYREHSYLVSLPRPLAITYMQALSGRLELRNGIGSFEFLGTVEDLKTLFTSGHYRFDNFPKGCWSWNNGVGKTPFALDRASFLRPVLNLNVEPLADVGTAIDHLGSKIVRCSFVRKYVPWKLRSGRLSPRIQGNYAMLSTQKKGYALMIGFDQYADDDPPLKEFKDFVTPLLVGMGCKLKPIPYIK